MAWKANTKLWNSVADLEKNDPEVRALSDKIRDADDNGRGTDKLNGQFEKLVNDRLGRK